MLKKRVYMIVLVIMSICMIKFDANAQGLLKMNGAERVEATGKFALLKTYLMKNGLTDSEGNKYFQEVFEITQNSKDVATISYIETDAQFKFCYGSYTKNRSTGRITMFIEENGSQTVTVDYGHDVFSLYASSTFDSKDYTKGGTVYFEKTASNILDNSEIQELCNATLKSAFGGWDIIFLKHLGFDVNMADMGFTSYEEVGTHTMDDGKVTTNATCGQDGTKTYTCVICGDTRTEVIAKTGMHTWDEGKVTTNATCGQDGMQAYTCVICGDTRTEVIAKTGTHTWNEGKIITTATYEKTGVKEYRCNVCNEIKTEIIPVLAVPKKGRSIKDTNGIVYKVTKAGISGGTVEYKKTNGDEKVVVIPDSVTLNGIKYKVTSIGANVFKNNTKLTKVTIGKNVQTIGDNAFYKCKALKKITFPSKVKKIGKQAFFGCNRLKNITMTAGKLKTIDKNAFQGIDKKAQITVKGTKKAKTSLKKKLKNEKIGYVKTWKIK